MCIGYFCIPFDEQLLLVVLGIAFGCISMHLYKEIKIKIKRIKNV